MKKILIVLLSLGLVLAMIIGCSDDDDNPTVPSGLETGSLTDPEFILAEEAFLGAEDFSDFMFAWMGDFIDSVFAEAPPQGVPGGFVAMPAGDSIFMTYHGGSQYWYLYFRSDDTVFGLEQVVEEIVTVILHDSIQFLHGEEAVQWPDSMLLTRVINGAGLAITTLTGVGNASATQNLTAVGDAGALALKGDVTINGTRTFSLGLTDESGQCTADLDASATATDILMNLAEMEADGCPQSGNLVHVAAITIECTGDTTFTFSDTWTFDRTFFGDSTKVVVENSTTRWTFTDTCDVVSGSSRPYAELFARIKER